MNIRVYGIRHHGPGSARSLLEALQANPPDVLLLEGPPEGEAALEFLRGETAAEMQPPLALLLYAKDEPRRGVYFPFTEFSPEWQALTFALARGIPVRFMDLPQGHQLALEKAREEELDKRAEEAEKRAEQQAESESEEREAQARDDADDEDGEDGGDLPAPAVDGTDETPALADLEAEPEDRLPPLHQDPLTYLARAAGYADGERW
jgi:hypothetical protein